MSVDRIPEWGSLLASLLVFKNADQLAGTGLTYKYDAFFLSFVAAAAAELSFPLYVASNGHQEI